MNDLHATRLNMLAGGSDARTELERAIGISESPACSHVFTCTLFDEARQQVGRSAPQSRLAGLAFTAKDLFDIEGQPTPAGSVVLSHAPVAKADAVAVARLRAAGGVLTGRTNMTEFAFSGVGVNPHHGTPVNASDAATPRIPGGSSSGAAVSVATGAAFIGLGSDTGGSIRIPAALNGIVGFKSTARLVPADGALPLSTAGAASLGAYRLAVVKNVFFDDIEPAVASAFEKALQTLRNAGAQVEEIELPELAELQAINATGGFSAAESYAWHRLLLERSGAGYDPRVAQRILRGASMKAHEYIDLVNARRAWIASVAPGAERDDEFFRVNALLLRNPSIVNMLDGCAISLPCHEAGELPVGLMLWHAALHDDAILAIALQAEHALRRQ
jgi:aspartyl-tRNA(Asn)/glutamyl-tRNA(Gln) amidotransferase subunit A